MGDRRPAAADDTDEGQAIEGRRRGARATRPSSAVSITGRASPCRSSTSTRLGPEPTLADLREPVHRAAARLPPEVATGRPGVVGAGAASGRSRSRAGGVDEERRDGRAVRGGVPLIAADGRTRLDPRRGACSSGRRRQRRALAGRDDGHHRSQAGERRPHPSARPGAAGDGGHARADEIKTTFLTAVSHDIRTPLSRDPGQRPHLEDGDRLGITDEERKQLIHSLAAKAAG